MARLSLCLIARDEEALLPACLASVAGVVDEVVVADTGSRDGTARVARERGARVLEVPWRDDFSEPRNATLAAASGDFVLILDADERLAPGSGPRLRAALEGARFDCGMIRLHNARSVDADPALVLAGAARLGPPNPLPRVLRRTADLRYEGIVHESVSDWLARRGMRVAGLDVDVIHLGAVEALRAERGKLERNLGLLRRRCALEPGSITPFAYLALELAGSGRMPEAREVAERAWALLPGQPPDRSVLRLAVARALAALWADQAAPALEAVALAEAAEGPQPDLAYLRGRALLRAALDHAAAERERALDQAEEAFRRALSLATAHGLRQYVAGAASWAAWTGVGHVLLWRGRAAEAGTAFRTALAEASDRPEPRLGEAEVLLEEGRPGEALPRLEPLLDDAPDGWALAAEAALALGAAADARGLAAAAEQRSGRGFRAPHRRERLDRLRARLEEAAGRGS
ncbi:MAG TPA: glycosyltransferase [Anaeromyxobacter sp.]|nr:glycosyltransferase [Anaeromyxobacter sp.]